MKHFLPELPFQKNALEPEISAETIEPHYGKHHASYVQKPNSLTRGTRYEDMSMEETVTDADGGVVNNAAQVWNANFYWQRLKPGGPSCPGGGLARAIQDAYGNFEKFKNKSSDSAAGNLGLGWTWLALSRGGKLEIINTGKAGTPVTEGKTPLLTCDVCEHAHYIGYRNARLKYTQAVWNRINREFAGRNFAAAGCGR